MKYRNLAVVVMSAFMIFVCPRVLLAHSSLVSTVPNEISDTKVTEITMNLSEDLESAAKVKVTNASGEEQAVKTTKANGKVLTAILEQPLTDGVYTVEWRVISVDGHSSKGSFSFEVKLPAPVSTPESSAASPESSLPAHSASPSVSSSQPSAAASSAPAEQSSSGGFDVSTLLLAGAAVILIAAIAVAFLKRKK